MRVRRTAVFGGYGKNTYLCNVRGHGEKQVVLLSRDILTAMLEVWTLLRKGGGDVPHFFC